MSTEKFRERLRKIARGNYKDLARRADILPSRMQSVKRHAKLYKNDTLNCTGGCYDKLRRHPWCAVGKARG